MFVLFDEINGCRFCIGCGRRGPDAPLVTEGPEEPTVVDFVSSEEVTQIGSPDAELIAVARRERS